MLQYEVNARRIDSQGSIVHCKEAELVIDTGVEGRADAFNPAELLLAAVAACILKNMERIAPVIHFDYHGVRISVWGERQDAPPKMARIDYEIVVECEEDEHKLVLMHENIRKFGTIYNTLADACELTGTLRRAE